MKLEPTSIQALAPKAAPYKAADSNGLYLLIQPNGARYWRFRYRWKGGQNTLSCGIFPAVSLETARAKRDEFLLLLSEGINPSERAKLTRQAELREGVRQQRVRFMLDSDGAMSFRLGRRQVFLSPSETTELRAFLEATRAVTEVKSWP